MTDDEQTNLDKGMVFGFGFLSVLVDSKLCDNDRLRISLNSIMSE